MSDLDIDDMRLRRWQNDATDTAVADGNRMWRLTCAAGMAAIMAHDLAQPLTAINALVSTALKAARSPMPDKDKLVDNLKKIEREARRASDTILGFAQYAHRGASDIGVADLNVVLPGILAQFRDEAQRHGITVKHRIAPGLPPVAAAPTTVEQIAACLIRNAIDALTRGAGERREISIAAAPSHDGMIEVAVVDNGPGIDPEFTHAIFDPFASDRPLDWGIGLAVSQTIIGALGGRIGVKSNNGRGAVVAFALPPAEKGNMSGRRNR